MSELTKWNQTFRIAITNQLAYKLNFFLLAIGPSIVFFLIRYNLWSSIYTLKGIDLIQGYTLAGMLEYQSWVMIVMLPCQTFSSRNLAEDIRLGRITSYLLYPFEFWKFHAASYAAYFSVQFFVAAFSLLLFLLAGFIGGINLLNLAVGVLFIVSVSALWFIVYYILGLAAFWLEETWTLRVIVMILVQFLSGSAIPLELFPKLLLQILSFTPFPYMTWAPVKIITGTYEGDPLFAWLVLATWFLIFIGISQLVWKRGIGRYSAAGI